MAGAVALWVSRWKMPDVRPRAHAGRAHPAGRRRSSPAADGARARRAAGAVIEGLTDWLNGLTGTSAILLGIILGLMMAFDLGGPVNKAAYAFATAGLALLRRAAPGSRS